MSRAEPLTARRRELNYAAQCGARTVFREPTPAQRRRIRKKANRAAA